MPHLKENVGRLLRTLSKGWDINIRDGIARMGDSRHTLSEQECGHWSHRAGFESSHEPEEPDDLGKLI